MTQKILWLLDNGHAPRTRGKRSPKLPDGTRLLEWSFTRDVVDKIARKLEGRSIAHHILTPRTDKDLGPTARAELANFIAKQSKMKAILVSVHANAAGRSGWSTANGAVVLHYPRSKTSIKLAQALQDKLVSVTGLRDRGLRPRGNLSILKKTHMPAILSECGFYTNRKEVDFLLSNDGREAFADAHVEFMVETEKQS